MSHSHQYAYRILNVFAESTFGGNPLCVFENAASLNTADMQALALQFNLSETTFILPSTKATAHVRIFTPTFEMAFAGHPTLGSAHVVRDLFTAGDSITLEMKAGIIPVKATNDRWTLSANTPSFREFEWPKAELAAALGLDERDIADHPLWVNTGNEQLIVPLASTDAVKRAQPKPDLLNRIKSKPSNGTPARSMSYIFAPQENDPHKLVSRFFFMKHESIIEDPGTGSATANLGGWMIATKHTLPAAFEIEQGALVNRLCNLGLKIDANQQIFVSGRVIEIARGVVTLPA